MAGINQRSPGPASIRPPPRAGTPQLGAIPTREGTVFRVWSTRAREANVLVYSSHGQAKERLPLSALEDGLFERIERGVGPGALYSFELDGRELPDPYARSLPDGVNGPARVEARGRLEIEAPRPLSEWVIYELHVGTFTADGTFRAALERLPELSSLGVTCVELMPVSSFSGRRGWGYDGVSHFAPHAAYGRPADLRELVAAAHELGMMIILDVVYNHFGPAGNFLTAYSPEYFTARHKTPWGDSPDFANPYMRAYFTDNARYWLEEFGFDGLRLDATHQIVDPSPVHLLSELSATVATLSPRRLLIAEDERNDPRLVGEHRLSALWADDFHHVLHVLLTREQDGYYAGYRGDLAELARVIERGWLYEGQTYTPTGKRRGSPADTLAAEQLVYSIQNHDQIGNRALGERLSSLVDHSAYSAASMLLLFLPMIPLLFMGQEWKASSPFLYFTDHEPALGDAVTRGRREEFKHFTAFADPEARARIPDPQSEQTFLASKLRWGERGEPEHARVLALYHRMLELRRTDPVLRQPSRDRISAQPEGDLLIVRRSLDSLERWLIINFGSGPHPVPHRFRGLPLLVAEGVDETRHELGPRGAALLAGNSPAQF